MNSPLVVESAKNLVLALRFRALSSDEERIKFLYLSLYQRMPSAEEIHLGLGFCFATAFAGTCGFHARRRLSQTRAGDQARRDGSAKRHNAEAREPMKSRAPLTAWQEYAHALMQGMSFRL